MPHPPAWATNAGLPEPRDGETFAEYVKRLGLNAEELLDGLGERHEELANVRLESKLIDAMPKQFSAYAKSRLRAVHAEMEGRHARS